jgi:hypothetical protein
MVKFSSSKKSVIDLHLPKGDKLISPVGQRFCLVLDISWNNRMVADK